MEISIVFFIALLSSMVTIMNGIQWAIEFSKDKNPSNIGQIFLITLTSIFWTIFYSLN